MAQEERKTPTPLREDRKSPDTRTPDKRDYGDKYPAKVTRPEPWPDPPPHMPAEPTQPNRNKR